MNQLSSFAGEAWLIEDMEVVPVPQPEAVELVGSVEAQELRSRTPERNQSGDDLPVEGILSEPGLGKNPSEPSVLEVCVWSNR